MKSLVLLFIALTLAVIVLPIAFCIGVVGSILKWEFSKYFFDIAISIDQSGNVVCKYLFDLIFISDQGISYGNIGETISSCTGKNKINGTLSVTGLALYRLLNAIDNNHCENSINETNRNI